VQTLRKTSLNCGAAPGRACSLHPRRYAHAPLTNARGNRLGQNALYLIVTPEEV
jgi:hypothetical protein